MGEEKAKKQKMKDKKGIIMLELKEMNKFKLKVLLLIHNIKYFIFDITLNKLNLPSILIIF